MRGNLSEAAVICPVLRATWGVARPNYLIGAVWQALNRHGAQALIARDPLRSVHVRILCLAVAALSLLVAGCGGGGGGKPTRRRTRLRPPVRPATRFRRRARRSGFPVLATKNTTRIAGGDAIADAAAIALATYPARTPESKPAAVILAEVRDWRTGIAASVLVGRPIKAPILFADGDTIPDATKAALDALQPTGSKEAGGAQVIRVGTKAPVEGYKTTDIAAANPAALAAAVDRVRTAAAGAPSGAIVIASADRPEYAMPAAGWAAKSGEPRAVGERDRRAAGDRGRDQDAQAGQALRPRARRRRLRRRRHRAREARHGQAHRRRRRGDHRDHLRALLRRTATSAGRWSTRATGSCSPPRAARRTPRRPRRCRPRAPSGRCCCSPTPASCPRRCRTILLDIQPGYDADPVRGVYNHGWIIGDESAIAAAVQARIDTLLEIQPVDTGAP